MEHFKTIARFTYPSDYAVLKLVLQQNEIRHVFLNETVINVLPFHSNAFGGIRLQVHENDEQKAIKIMKDLDSTSDLKIV
ncbi:MAG: hypothetical protein ACI9SJ_002236 [Flavobacteriaceae bacterium]|jgi:hypothetical protein|uniref:DUF2007 domain-containing protein n=1 Tax=Candidatus Marifrigoribacter sp. Uisw_064 TaxID=3230970 RepID=UPI003AE6E2C2|tara:strand:+ start:230 stop:469 length:240 start_codon:yes stop_codon:yes gene_type:complete